VRFALVLVDGHCIFRQALRILLGAEKSFAVVARLGGRGGAGADRASCKRICVDRSAPAGTAAACEFIEQLRTRFPLLRFLCSQHSGRACGGDGQEGRARLCPQGPGSRDCPSALRELPGGALVMLRCPAARRGRAAR